MTRKTISSISDKDTANRTTLHLTNQHPHFLDRWIHRMIQKWSNIYFPPKMVNILFLIYSYVTLLNIRFKIKRKYSTKFDDHKIQ